MNGFGVLSRSYSIDTWVPWNRNCTKDASCHPIVHQLCLCHFATQRTAGKKRNLGMKKSGKLFCPLERRLETNGPGFQPLPAS